MTDTPPAPSPATTSASAPASAIPDATAAAAPAAGRWRGRVRNGALIVAGALASFIGQDVYGWVRDKMVPPDDSLQRLAEQQAERFDALSRSLDALRGSVDGQGREALAEVRAASESLRAFNDQVLAKLDFARRENEAMQRNLQASRGVEGGYDVLLARGESMRIDASTVLGLTSVHPNNVYVNISSADRSEGSQRVNLRPGEAAAYVDAGGRACTVTLLTLRRGSDVVSFALNCAGAAPASA